MSYSRNSVTSFIAGTFAAGAIGLGAYALSSSSSNAGVVAAQPAAGVQLVSQKKEVREALDHLKQARDLLKDADHDEKGHDHKALEYTKQAISELEEKIGD
jgi:hypothetical protein